MKLGILMYLAPRKRGSWEDWLLGLAREARARRHEVDIYGLEPVHPRFLEELERLGVGLGSARALERTPVASARQLARYDCLVLHMVEVRDRLAFIADAAWPARVIWVDHAAVYDAVSPARAALAPLLRIIDRVSAARLDAVVGVSEYVRQRDLKRFGFPEARICTIPNGVDVQRFQPAPRQPTGGPFTILSVAHLIRQKGVHHLLSAVARAGARDLRVRVVGDGPELPRLQALARDLHIQDRVELLGLRDDVDRLLQEAHLLVQPVLCPETFGLVIAEAMASGCAVVASGVGGIPELVRDGESGLLVPPGDEGALAEAIVRVQRDEGFRATLARNGRARVVERFSLERSVEEHLRLYESVVARAPTRRRAATGEPPHGDLFQTSSG